jgi:hypothetical protein
VRRAIATVATGLFVACSGASEPARTTPAPTIDPTTPTEAPTFTPTEEPSPSPEPEPGSMPTSYAPDDEAGAIPPESLVPVGATVVGQWFAFTDDGVQIAIAWAEPGVDVDRVPRGLAVWRHTGTSPHWRTAFVRSRPGRAGIVEVEAITADVTGDRSDELLFFEGIGGSGGCGTWFVVELLEHRSIYRKQLCDGRVEPAPPKRPGLLLTESVYEPGDAHCCPSAIRRTTLAWTGSGWRVTDRTESPT